MARTRPRVVVGLQVSGLELVEDAAKVRLAQGEIRVGLIGRT